MTIQGASAGSAAAAEPGGARLFASTLGEHGPRVVFLHGLFGQGKNWTTLARSLAGEARVTLLDLPDHGRSAWSTEISYPGMATQVADRLGEEGGGEPYAVVGHSMGGKVAMALALLRPALVSRLCVVDVAPADSGLTAEPSTDPGSNFARYAEAMRSLDLSRLPDRATADAGLVAGVPDPVVRSFLLQNLRRDGDGWRWQMNLALLAASLPTIGAWPDLTAPPFAAGPYPGPVLWVAGSESDYIRPEHAAAMRALFPRVRTVTVKGAGHWVHADQPEVFAALVRRFLFR